MDPAPPSQPAPAQPAPALLAPGSELAGYRIEALLGRGGMGEVYRARQLSLARTVPLKVLSPQLARRDPACVPRFIAEARAAGRFYNPCIVRVHDVGEAAAPPALARPGSSAWRTSRWNSWPANPCRSASSACAAPMPTWWRG